MAEIRIQPKKTAPSPWLLVLLAAALLALAAYFFLRPDPAEAPTPAAASNAAGPAAQPAPAETAPETVAPAIPAPTTPAAAAPTTASAADAPPELPDAAPPTPAELAAYAATDAAAPGYARRGLQLLTAAAVDLTDRADLQDPAIQEQRNNLTSATARLSEDAGAPLRPGYVAAAGLLQAIQQKAYPEQQAAAGQLQQLAGQLSGRSTTAPEQQATRRFLSAAAALLAPLSQLPTAQ